MTYPIGGQFNIGSSYMPYSTLGTSYGNPYQTSMFGGCSTSSSSGMDMSSMMSFMMQMKQLEAMNQTTTTTSNSIAESSSSSGYDSTEIGNFETDGSDLDAFKDFINNQNTATTLHISNNNFEEFASNLLIALNEEAEFSDTENISLSRALNALGIQLTPTQADQLAYSLGIDPEQDLDGTKLADVLEHLGFRAGENNRYNVNFEMEKAIKKINDNTSYKIQDFDENNGIGSNSGDTKKMDSKEFTTTFNAFKETAPANAKLTYGSLDNLSEHLLKACKDSTINSSGTSTIKDVLNQLGIDADTMSEQTLKELLYKAGIGNLDSNQNSSTPLVRTKPSSSHAPGDHTSWTSSGDGYSGGAGWWKAFGHAGLGGAASGAAAGAAIGACFGGIGALPGALIGGLLGAVGGSAYAMVEGEHNERATDLQKLYNNSAGIPQSPSVEGIKNSVDLTTELDEAQIKKVLIALGFGETSVTKSDFEAAINNDITFTKSNIKDQDGNNIFNTFLCNINAEDCFKSGNSGQVENSDSLAAIDTLVNTILASDDTVKQASIEAFFTDFPDFVDDFIRRAIDTTAWQTTETVPMNVYKLDYFFQAAQDLINATTDPDKKMRFKIAYNAGVDRLAQLAGSSCVTVSDVDMATQLQQTLKFSGSELTDNTTGYSGL